MKSNKNLGDYISIPIHAREIYDLKGNDLLVYGLIHGFSKDGVNWYTNCQQYICDWIGVTDTKSVRRIIDRLIEIGAIEKQEVWQNNVRFVNYRAICPDWGQNAPTTGVKMPYNNIIDNITPNNPTLFSNKDSVISPATSKRVKSYSRPTLEEVAAYCEERNNGIDPQYFLDYQNARGWLIGGKTPIKDWKAAVRTWETKDKRDKRPLEVRRDEFYDKVNAFLRTPEYAGEKELLYGFYNYWAQVKDDRMLWEMQPAFDIERRLRIEKTKRKN